MVNIVSARRTDGTPSNGSSRRARTTIPFAPPDPELTPPPAVEPRLLQRADRIVATVPALIAALVTGVVAAVLGTAIETPLESGGVVFAALGGAAVVVGAPPSWAALMPLVGSIARLRGPLVALLVLLVLDATVALPGLGLYNVLALFAVAVIVGLIAERLVVRWFAPLRRRRVAVIGSGWTADALDRELRLKGDARYAVVGRISVAGEAEPDDGASMPVLGDLDELGDVVRTHQIGLLLMTGDAPRLAVFEEVTRSCLDLPVRLRELTGFYEDVFGHVAVGEINASWFQYIMHPRYRAAASPGARAIDLIVAGATAILTLPLVAVLVLVVRRDGGPAFFRQTRVGAGGKPFTMIKLRTMREGASSDWAAAADPRVTPIGRILRRTHLDELPQVYNVLRGDMRIVGPRPEQAEFVERLERTVPFYQRRHLIKPGLTGWAQVRCGYAGSDMGSAWKVCHDLYYLKHRSVTLDVAILIETLRTLVADPQYSAQPSDVAFILGGAAGQLEVSPGSAPG